MTDPEHQVRALTKRGVFSDPRNRSPLEMKAENLFGKRLGIHTVIYYHKLCGLFPVPEIPESCIAATALFHVEQSPGLI